MTTSHHAWKAIGAAVLAYEAAAEASRRERIQREIPFITDKVRPRHVGVRFAASLASAVLVERALRPLPSSVRFPVATLVGLELVDHFRPTRMGFFPFAQTITMEV
jgi:hypothetical protein